MYRLIETSELEQMRSVLFKQNEEIVQQNKKIIEQGEEILALKREIEKMQDKLNINSSNSGLPTSKEIYKREKGVRPKSDKKPRGQPGQKARGYNLRAADEINEIKLN